MPEFAAPLENDRRIAEALEFLQGCRDSMIARLRGWCQQNSGSANLPGLQKMADLLVEDFAPIGVRCQRIATPHYSTIDDEGNRQENQSGDLLLWHHAPELPRRVLMMIHYDTVYPPESAGGREAESAEGLGAEGERGSAGERGSVCSIESGGRLVGPGTADAKGGLLVMREALLVARRFELDRGIGWTALANPDEEIGSPASEKRVAELARQHAFGLLFEPALPDGALVAGRNGSGNFSLVVRGRSAHAGRNPQEGRNAVAHLCRILAAIDQMGPAVPQWTVNVARVRGGGPLNRVPDLAVGRFNARVVDAAAESELLRRLHELIAPFQQADGFQVTLQGGFHAPPKTVDASMRALQQRVERAAAGIGRQITWRDTGGASDGNRLAAAGLANIDTLGPRGDRLHSPGEWVDVDSLVPAAQTLLLIIAHYASEIRRERSARD